MGAVAHTHFFGCRRSEGRHIADRTNFWLAYTNPRGWAEQRRPMHDAWRRTTYLLAHICRNFPPERGELQACVSPGDVRGVPLFLWNKESTLAVASRYQQRIQDNLPCSLQYCEYHKSDLSPDRYLTNPVLASRRGEMRKKFLYRFANPFEEKKWGCHSHITKSPRAYHAPNTAKQTKVNRPAMSERGVR